MAEVECEVQRLWNCRTALSCGCGVGAQTMHPVRPCIRGRRLGKRRFELVIHVEEVQWCQFLDEQGCAEA